MDSQKVKPDKIYKRIVNFSYLCKMRASSLGHIITDYVNSMGDSVSPKKLQKLVYYVEAWHLVHFDKALVKEDFEAWMHGPVVPDLYREFKKFGFNNIRTINDELDLADARIRKVAKANDLSDNQLELIFSVLNRYGPLSSFELEMLTHSEKPWIEARADFLPHQRCTNIISKDVMKRFYTSQLDR